MPDANIKIVRYGDPPPFPADSDADLFVATDSWKVAILEGGMSSGLPSVGLQLDVPGVGRVMAQTSLAMVTAIVLAGRGAFPEAFVGGPLEVP